MTLKELQAKNEAIRKRRAEEQAKKAEEIRQQEEKQQEEAVEQPAPKKRGRKPANRAYLVVESIPEEDQPQ